MHRRPTARFARKAGAVFEQLFDGDAVEARVQRLPQLSERARKHGCERRGERQAAFVDQASDADTGNRLRKARNAGRLRRVHPSIAEGADDGPVLHGRQRRGWDGIFAHPFPHRRIERGRDLGKVVVGTCRGAEHSQRKAAERDPETGEIPRFGTET